MKKSLTLVVAFLVFLLGGVGLVLKLIGVRLKIISGIDQSLGAWALLLYLLLLIVGISVAYVALMQEDQTPEVER